MQDFSQRTLSFLVRGDQVLLGYKKTGFGKGNYLGIGGKIEAGETDEEAAAREMYEEIMVTHPVLQRVGEFDFLFPEQPSWSQGVRVFLCSQWEGEPSETTEIRPEWRSKEDLPFNEMWDDARFWLTDILNGQTLRGSFTFNTELKIVQSEIAPF